MLLLSVLNIMRFAADPCEGFCDTNDTGLSNVTANQSNVTAALQLTFGAVGAIALIFIIISGLRLTTSLGDPAAFKKARNTLVFAAIGMAVALSAEAIVTFVLGRA